MPGRNRSTESVQLPVAIKVVENRILVLGGRRVMLARDLAGLYGVETRVLNLAGKRNNDLFPEDFTIQLTPKEARDVLASRSQTVILKRGVKYRPFVFTGHGAVGEYPGSASIRSPALVASRPCRTRA